MFVLLYTEDLKLKMRRHPFCSTLLCMEMLPLLCIMPDQRLVERFRERYAMLLCCITSTNEVIFFLGLFISNITLKSYERIFAKFLDFVGIGTRSS